MTQQNPGIYNGVLYFLKIFIKFFLNYNNSLYFSTINSYFISVEQIKGIIKDGSFFLYLYFIVLTASLTLLLCFSKSEIHIWINSHHNSFFDFFFSKITFLGDGICAIVICLFLLYYKIGYSIFTFFAYSLSGIFVQILKHTLFSGSIRPMKYFLGKYTLHLVDGVKMYSIDSFPSGHSATAFAVFLFLAFIARKKLWQVVFFVLACLVAYSRMYLSQHFLIDVTAGSIIGVLTSFSLYLFYQKISYGWLNSPLKWNIKTRN
jgi:membrane-associated phospholipid phosphatase